jgi:hypothetical protein
VVPGREPVTASRGRRRRWLPWLLFGLVLFPYLRSEVETPYDSGYTMHLALSLIEEGDLDLDEYRELIPEDDYRVMTVDGHLVSRYPVAPAVFVLPMVVALRSVMNQALHIPIEKYVRQGSAGGTEKLLASVLMAWTAVLVFLFTRRALGDGLATLASLLFAFGTSAWSVVSRGLWQHGPSILLLTVALYLLHRSLREPRWVQYASLPLVAAYFMRPTNSLAVIAVTAYVMACRRRWLLRFLAWGAPVGLAFTAIHQWTYGTPLPWYFRPQEGSMRLLDGDFVSAAAGVLTSPGRGLFVYSPIFLLSLGAMIWKLCAGRWSGLDTALAAVLAGHWLVISSWYSWWGGTVFGPRLFADLIPVWLYFLLPALAALRTPGARRWWLATALVATAVPSFLIHRAGAREQATWEWNIRPSHVDQDPSRLWDWGDPPFLRGG